MQSEKVLKNYLKKFLVICLQKLFSNLRILHDCRSKIFYITASLFRSDTFITPSRKNDTNWKNIFVATFKDWSEYSVRFAQ